VNRLQAEVARIEKRLAAHESANAERFSRIEARLEEHAALLADVPTSSEINAAMEDLLSKTLRSLDSRLQVHAKSIDELKSTVSQTDSLLRQVLVSLDAMQAGIDANPVPERPRTAEVLAIEHPQQRSRRRQA
jgi:chromosome segregation ATPase